MLSLAFFVLGAITASFAGVVAARLHTGQSYLSGRSRCDACGKLLGASDLVPILSYVRGHGRARCCGGTLSALSPTAELALGALFLLAYGSLGLSRALPFFLLALFFLTVLVLYDLAHQILPPSVLVFFVGSAFIARMLIDPPGAFGVTLAVASGIALFLAAIHVFSRGRAMGLADAPLAFGLALLAGPVALSGFIYAFWIGAVLGIILLARRPRGSRMGVEVPFAPYLAAGFLLAYFTTWNLFSLIAALR